MRILHVTHQYYPAVGGAERYITDLSEELARRGHQVDVYTSRSVDYRTWQDVLPSIEMVNGVRVRRFRSVRRSRLVWWALDYGYGQYWRTRQRRFEPLIFIGNGPVCPGMFISILLTASRYDVLHISNLHYAQAWTAYTAARLRHLPTLITPHVHAEQLVTHDVGYMWDILQGSDAVITVTRAEKDYLVRRGLRSELVVGGNGLRLEDFPALDRQASRAHYKLPQEGFVMLFLGRKTDYKGLDVCLAAFRALRQVRRDVYFLAVGPETDFSRQLWTQYNGLEGLYVYDQVSDEERLAALAACDVLALPSTGEAFGIVYLEAWAYAKPVIGVRIASVSSLIQDGIDGFLIPPLDSEALASKIQWLVEHPQAVPQMGQQGYEKLKRQYTVECITDIVEGAYARVVRRRRMLRQ